MKDPIVEEVRRHRQNHSERFANDLDGICDDLQRHQAVCGHKIVRLNPKKIIPTKQSSQSTNRASP